METIHKGTRRGHKSPFVARWWATRRWTIEDNAIVTTNATTIFAATYCKSASGGCLTPNQDHTRTVFTYTCITHYHLYKILHRHIYVKILLYTKAISTHTFSENNRHLDTLYCAYNITPTYHSSSICEKSTSKHLANFISKGSLNPWTLLAMHASMVYCRCSHKQAWGNLWNVLICIR